MSKLSVLNPFKSLLTEQEASMAARAGAVGALLSAASSALAAIELYLQKDSMLAVMREGANLQKADPEVARQASAMMESSVLFFAVGSSLVIVVIYLIFGLIQWRRRTKAIPFVMLFIALLGIAMTVLGLLMPQPSTQQAAAVLPAWQLTFNWIVEIVILALLWAGVRGGDRLQKLRSSAATSPNPPASSAR